MSSLLREAAPITQERLQRLSMYESILSILIDELSYDLEHGGEVEPGILVAIKGETGNSVKIICSESNGHLMTIGQKPSLAIDRADDDFWPLNAKRRPASVRSDSGEVTAYRHLADVFSGS